MSIVFSAATMVRCSTGPNASSNVFACLAAPSRSAATLFATVSRSIFVPFALSSLMFSSQCRRLDCTILASRIK